MFPEMSSACKLGWTSCHQNWKSSYGRGPQMISTQPSRGLRGAQSFHRSLCALPCMGADDYAAHMRRARHQVFKLHSRRSKAILPKTTSWSVIYIWGSDRALRPQSSKKLTAVMAHTPQAWPLLASGPATTGLRPSFSVLPCSSLLSAEANIVISQITGHSASCVSTLLRGTAGRLLVNRCKRT